MAKETLIFLAIGQAPSSKHRISAIVATASSMVGCPQHVPELFAHQDFHLKTVIRHGDVIATFGSTDEKNVATSEFSPMSVWDVINDQLLY